LSAAKQSFLPLSNAFRQTKETFSILNYIYNHPDHELHRHITREAPTYSKLLTTVQPLLEFNLVMQNFFYFANEIAPKSEINREYIRRKRTFTHTLKHVNVSFLLRIEMEDIPRSLLDEILSGRQFKWVFEYAEVIIPINDCTKNEITEEINQFVTKTKKEINFE
jgi:hypothetical protein